MRHPGADIRWGLVRNGCGPPTCRRLNHAAGCGSMRLRRAAEAQWRHRQSACTDAGERKRALGPIADTDDSLQLFRNRSLRRCETSEHAIAHGSHPTPLVKPHSTANFFQISSRLPRVGFRPADGQSLRNESHSLCPAMTLRAFVRTQRPTGLWQAAWHPHSESDSRSWLMRCTKTAPRTRVVPDTSRLARRFAEAHTFL